MDRKEIETALQACEFFRGLADEGRVTVAPLVPLDADALRAGDQVLAEFNARYRRDWPAEPPEVDLPIARRAAVVFYRACQFLVFRDLGARPVSTDLVLFDRERATREATPGEG